MRHHATRAALTVDREVRGQFSYFCLSHIAHGAHSKPADNGRFDVLPRACGYMYKCSLASRWSSWIWQLSNVTEVILKIKKSTDPGMTISAMLAWHG